MKRALLLIVALLSAVLLSTGEEKPAASADLAAYDALIKSKDRAHWAFQPVQSPAIPNGKDRHWVSNPIDAFVLAKLEEKGWKPPLPADQQSLLRRVYLDVIGLPPTPAEQDAFLKDSLPDTLESTVDNLLARPTYGERWGRHWLDLVRYAESNGYERDGTKPNVWRYRDYVINAFNQDKPFDRFIVEQLAGDELPDANGETMMATTYNRLGPWDDEPADFQEDRFDQLDDMVSTTSQVFLGLTLGCARCHNHKFEPLTALDYYRMVAVFNPLQRPQIGRTELDLPAGSRAELAAATQRDRQIRKAVAPAIANQFLFKRQLLLAVAGWLDCGQEVGQLRNQIPDLPRGYFFREPSGQAPTTHLLLRGKASRPGPQVAAGIPAVIVKSQPEFLPPDQHTTRRRLSLARWIASPNNPLTARVIVNRVWQFHFGEGLVRTSSDFGTMGELPTHPELLDWLAHWFVQEGWSLKKLHRLILTSNTYRMSKRWNSEYGKEDPENHLLWRFPYRRLEVEAIRDSMLAVSGQLNTQMFGASTYPEIPKEVLAAHSDPDKVWKPFDEKEASRRTIYAHVKRSMIVPMLEVLDLCDTARTSAKRNVTTVASQALTLLNGDFVNRQSRYFARRLEKEVGLDREKLIERAYVLALCRKPTSNERGRMIRYLHEEAEQAGKPMDEKESQRRALEQLCRVIFNLSEFVYPD